MMYKVNEYPNLVKDSGTKAVINTDQLSYESYVAQRNYREKVQTSTNHLEQEINNIKSEMTEIKSLLLQLLGNK